MGGGSSKKAVRAEVERSRVLQLYQQNAQNYQMEQRIGQELQSMTTAVGWAIQAQTKDIQAASMQLDHTMQRESRGIRDIVAEHGRSLQAQGQQIYNAVAGITPVIQHQTVAVRKMMANLGRSMGVECRNLHTGLQNTIIAGNEAVAKCFRQDLHVSTNELKNAMITVAVGIRGQLHQLRLAAIFIMALSSYLIYQFWKADAEREASNVTQAELVKNLTSAAIKSDLDEKFETFMNIMYLISGVVIVIQAFILGILILLWRASNAKANRPVSSAVAAVREQLQAHDARVADFRGQSSSNGNHTACGSSWARLKKKI